MSEEDEKTISSVDDTDESLDEELPSKTEFLYKQLLGFYNNKYYMETIKSLIVFIFGLKIARECYHIAIPVREYIPFASMQCK